MLRVREYSNLLLNFPAMKRTLPGRAICTMTLVSCLHLFAACSSNVEEPRIPLIVEDPIDTVPIEDDRYSQTDIDAPYVEEQANYPFVILLPEDEYLSQVSKDIQDGVLMAFEDLSDDRLRFLFSTGDRLLTDLQESPRGLVSEWPIYDTDELLAVIGPYGTKAAERFAVQKPSTVINFALTNDSTLGSEESYVFGLTPEQQAAFTVKYIPWRKTQEPLDFRPMLVKLGFGVRPELSEALVDPQDENSEETTDSYDPPDEPPLPVLVLGHPNDPFMERYVQALETVLSWRQPNQASGADNSTTQSAASYGGVVTAFLDSDKASWSETVQNLMRYLQRQQDFKDRVASVENDAIRELLENQEILEPSEYSAVVVILHNEADITWLSSLVEFYDNAWQRMPVIGVETWSNYPSLGRETSLNAAQFPRRLVSKEYDQRLSQQYLDMYDRPATLVAKQAYDLVTMIYRLWQEGSLSGDVLYAPQFFHQGWTGRLQIDHRGFVVPDLEMVAFGPSGIRNIDPDESEAVTTGP